MRVQRQRPSPHPPTQASAPRKAAKREATHFAGRNAIESIQKPGKGDKGCAPRSGHRWDRGF
eukprot:scaffold223843_cov24-Tisochrysis_lutea.AAC.1